MLEVEKEISSKILENKRHYVINDKKNPIIFNNRIMKRYATYYNTPTNAKYNLHRNHK